MKWEYLIVEEEHELLEGEYWDDWIEKRLNHFGGKGWEAISIKPNARHISGYGPEALYKACFKRPLIEAKKTVEPTEIPP
jgi:hypothetical protein